jgi:L-lactate permease
MAPATILGANLSDGLDGFFIAGSALLGALGSFLLGTNTASNLAFGRVQAVQSPCQRSSHRRLLNVLVWLLYFSASCHPGGQSLRQIGRLLYSPALFGAVVSFLLGTNTASNQPFGSLDAVRPLNTVYSVFLSLVLVCVAGCFLPMAALSDCLEGILIAGSSLLGALSSFLLGSSTASNEALGSVQAVRPRNAVCSVLQSLEVCV